MRDPQVTRQAIAGGRALVMHRMMRDGSKHWDRLSQGERLSAISEATVVLEAAEKVR